MITYTLNYTFTEQAGPELYSEQTDEVFYDTEDYDWDYEVTEQEVAEAFVNLYGYKNLYTLEQNCNKVAEELMSEEELAQSLEDLEASSLEEAISKAKPYYDRIVKEQIAKQGFSRLKYDARFILDYILGDIGYYLDQREDEIKDYFYDDAHEDFLENYNN